MKPSRNIHVLSTDKPSNGYILGKCIKELSDVKIGQFTKTYYLMFDNEYFQPHNIYITSDEDINENDYIITKDGRLVQVSYLLSEDLEGASKVIITTDKELIKDGVQAIDDEFLEWFVKNPSCEFVEVVTHYPTISDEGDYSLSKQYYTLTIPKEEPNPFELPKALPDDVFFKSLEEPKQETAEEAAVINYKELYQGEPLTQEVPIDAFIEGAKWQQEQYEILFDEYHEYTVDCIEVELKRPLPLQKWFKQFKKK
jgi:hypothetical protein